MPAEVGTWKSNVIIEHGIEVEGRKARLRLTSESPWGAPAILFSPASMALSDATVGPSVNSPPRGMTCEIRIWIEFLQSWFGIFWVKVGVCFATNPKPDIIVRV